MKFINRIIIAGMALIAIVACSSDGTGSGADAQKGETPISFTGSIGEGTRSSQDLQNTKFKIGTLVDVQITSNDGLTIFDPLVYRVSNTAGTLVPNNGVYPYYPINGSGISVRAIYPRGYMNESTFTVEETQTDDTGYLKSDLMFASATVPTSQTDAIDLNFQHKLTKICVNLTPEGNVDLAGAQVKLLQLYKTIGFNPNTGELVGDPIGSKRDFLIQSGGNEATVECAGIIVPQNFPGGYLIEIRLANNDILNYRSVQSIPFESGKKYTYNVTVTESNITVSSVVQPWLTTEDVTGRPRL